MKKIVFLYLSIFILWNCASSTAGIATSNIPISNKRYKVISPIEEQLSWYSFDIGILGIPFKKPPIDEMISKILKDKNADALVNIRYWTDKTIILFLTRSRFGLNAEAIKFEEEVLPPVNEKKKR
ncbi:MAG: hypothetical protein L6Q54_06060 [Leptospiraceae bacterium]|nr:hypothetical protein [Leptospiraceae bacterium]MCK6380800.1 hypothetical protein [Leptospiraceae bacterium]NUM42159.1 hypothetical protein [Leptospiraceae bacterium]